MLIYSHSQREERGGERREMKTLFDVKNVLLGARKERKAYDAATEAAEEVEETASIVLCDYVSEEEAAEVSEEMYEHGIFFDHHGLYEPNIHTPLLIKIPGQSEERRVTEHVRHQDIAATILDIAGIEIPPEMVGMSLVQFLRGETPANWRDDELLTEENSWMSKWALRKNGFKLIKARAKDWHGFPPRELYNISTDPGEMHNLVEAESVLADEMDAELEARISEGLKKYGRTVDPIVEQGLSPMGQRAWKWIKNSRYW